MPAENESYVGASEQGDTHLVTEQAGRLLQAACDFQARSAQAREKCREDFRRAEREEDSSLRISVDGQIAALEMTVAVPVAKVDPAVSYQIGLVTSYVRTHFVVTDLILNGDLVEAVTLIRKQLESLARLHELDDKPLERLHGRTPNVGLFFKHGGTDIATLRLCRRS